MKKYFRTGVILYALSPAIVAAGINLSTLIPKHIAAPPGEIAQLKLPKPSQHGIRSGSLLLPVLLEKSSSGNWVWAGDLPIADSSVAQFALHGPADIDWDVSIDETANKQATLSQLVKGEITRSPAASGYTNDLYQVSRSGTEPISIRITSPQATSSKALSTSPDGFIRIAVNSKYQLYTHLGSYDLLADNDISIVAYLYDNSLGPNISAKPVAVANILKEASIDVLTPSGNQVSLPMYDDGQHGDGAANDGVFGSVINKVEAGNYFTQVNVLGVGSNNTSIQLSSELFFPVITPTIVLNVGSASMIINSSDRLQVDINATSLLAEQRDIAVFAELWGETAAGFDAPITWFGGIVKPATTGTGLVLTLNLHPGWLHRTDAYTNLELRNIRVQDVATSIPLSRRSSLPVTVSKDFVVTMKSMRRLSPGFDSQSGAVNNSISQDMLMGKPVVSESNLFMDKLSTTDLYLSTSLVTTGSLMLVHGYCSGGVWPTADFTNFSVFQDFNQNRSHDEFAKLIRDYGAQFSSFGVVGHSQGGAASLHLYTYYWSGLDYSSGNRLIQSVGTPYQGTALAGSLALIGEIFGVGCGTNWNLTYDGAALWLAGIPSWARNRVYYHTTSFRDRFFRYDYCNLVSDLVLRDPDDGVVEHWAGQLAGANNMGHTTGQCHTTGMRDPAQYTDSARNSVMNSNANR